MKRITLRNTMASLAIMHSLFSLYYFASSAANFDTHQMMLGMGLAMMSALVGTYLFKTK